MFPKTSGYNMDLYLALLIRSYGNNIHPRLEMSKTNIGFSQSLRTLQSTEPLKEINSAPAPSYAKIFSDNFTV
jgi:hypothetical protein